MKQEYKNHTYYFWFDSFSEMSELVKPVWDFCPNTKQGIQNHKKLGRALYSYDDVQKAINSYWEHGMEVYEQMKGQLTHHRLEPPRSIRRKPTWSEDDGDEICLDRLKYGQPYWRTTKRDHRPGPISVTIVTDIATSWGTPPDQVLWRGAASVLLTELLEEAGYRVELWTVEKTTDNYYSGDNISTGVSLKQPADVLDVSTLINCVSAWSYRSVFFAARSLARLKSRMSLGHPTSPDIEMYTPDQQAIICQDIWAERAAVRWLEEQLTKFKNHEFNVPS